MRKCLKCWQANSKKYNMIILENESLKVTINSQGAELVSVIDKRNQQERIWQGNPEFWPFYAPHLFPVVGESVDSELTVDGNSYPIKRHGFARNSTFRRIESSLNHAQLALRYNEETLKSYPYKFEFQVVYHLTESELKIMYKVINMDNDRIYFSLGAHPGFTTDEDYTGYAIEFSNDDVLNVHGLSKNGLFDGSVSTLALENKKLNLSQNTFEKDAIVTKDLSSRSVKLLNKEGNGVVEVKFPHFNFLGLWAKKGASFVCIEPWLGCADTEGKKVSIDKKEGIMFVEHGHVFETEYCINIL